MSLNKVILICNYKPDGQESMQRFAKMLESGFLQRGIDVKLWYPTLFFGRFFTSTLSGVGKWFGYVDKWIIFPVVLRLRSIGRKNVKYHICDHSNSPYLAHLPLKDTSITCHDVLAIRGAFGHADAYCPASSTGKILQSWILNNLVKSKKIASVSHFTHRQLTELNKGLSQPGWIVIHNGFNAGFNVLPENEYKSRIIDNGGQKLLEKPYIIHVGSNLQRKNRKMLLNMVAQLEDKWDGYICFTGHVMNAELQALAAQLNLTDRVVEIKKPDHQYLEALINGAQAFVFPSFSEGFGWPVIEAQACGVPVLASNLQPMPEVGGEGALYADPYDANDFAAKLLTVATYTEVERVALVTKALKNTEQYNADIMMDRYVNFINN